MQKSFVRGERPQKRAYSPAVITDGLGKIIWIAGHTGHVDDNGKSLAGDFDAQWSEPQRASDKAGPSQTARVKSRRATMPPTPSVRLEQMGAKVERVDGNAPMGR
jgi:hypothetical protein